MAQEQAERDAVLQKARDQWRNRVLPWIIFAALIVILLTAGLAIKWLGPLNFLSAISLGLTLFLFGQEFVKMVRRYL